jgi:hypothetical protein
VPATNQSLPTTYQLVTHGRHVGRDMLTDPRPVEIADGADQAADTDHSQLDHLD